MRAEGEPPSAPVQVPTHAAFSLECRPVIVRLEVAVVLEDH